MKSWIGLFFPAATSSVYPSLIQTISYILLALVWRMMEEFRPPAWMNDTSEEDLEDAVDTT